MHACADAINNSQDFLRLEMLFSGYCALKLLAFVWMAPAVCSTEVPPQPLSYKYIGCYVDGSNGNRDLDGLHGVASFGPYNTYSSAPEFVLKMAPDEPMTLELCSQICSYGRFRYFGTQAQGFCGCDSNYGSLGAAPGGDCFYSCYGNTSQKCGGDSRNSVYENIYSSIGPTMTRLPVSSMPGISASASAITHYSLTAEDAIECAAVCHRSPDCLACAFVQSSWMCRLMRFAAVPSEVASEVQWVWVKY